MFSNTKLLIISSFFIIISGFSLLWFGLQTPAPLTPDHFPSPILTTQTVPIATSSAKPDLASAALGIEGEKVLVTKVVDGDTIVVGDRTVRLIGIDTPETVDPRHPVGCFGKEASNETKDLLSGKEVILQKDVSETDKYKRLLRYVYLPLERGVILFVNDYLVREGFAKVYTFPPDVKYNEQFRQGEAEAKANNRGLWGRCN